MHFVLDLLQGLGIAAAIGIRPFLPVLLAGILAAVDTSHYPDSLQELVLAGSGLSAEVFLCPSSNDDAAPATRPADIAASLAQPHHLSYTYLAKGLTTSAKPDTPLMAEPLDNHDRDGVNILFADGHVDFCRADDAKKLLGPALR